MDRLQGHCEIAWSARELVYPRLEESLDFCPILFATTRVRHKRKVRYEVRAGAARQLLSKFVEMRLHEFKRNARRFRFLRGNEQQPTTLPRVDDGTQKIG